MTCTATERQLLELPAWRFVELDHLASCAKCRAKAAAIRAGEEVLRADLEAFAGGGDLQGVLDRARASRGREPGWSSVVLVVAAAMVLWIAARGILGQPVLPGTGGSGPAIGPAEEGEIVVPERFEVAPVPQGSPDVNGETPSGEDVDAVPAEPSGDAVVAAPEVEGEVMPGSPDESLAEARRAYAAHRYAEAEQHAGDALAAAGAWPASIRLPQQNAAWQVRALAAYQQWVSAEQVRLDGARGDLDLFARSESSRRRAAESAQAWLHFCQANGLPEGQAFDLCLSATGTLSACRN